MVRKGDGAEGLRAKVMSSFSTNDAGEVSAAHVQFSIHTYNVHQIYEGIGDCHMHARYINAFYYYTYMYKYVRVC